MCIECGFNLETGQKLETNVYDEAEDDDYSMDISGKTDAEKIMSRAEKEIEDMPISAVGQNFGDGADSFVIAGIAFVVMAIFVAIVLVFIFIMDQVTEVVSTPFISFCASMGIYVICFLWISFVAFRVRPAHGLACLLTAGLYCPIFAFLQGKGLILPMIIMVASVFIGLISWAFWYYDIGGDDQLGLMMGVARAYLC